jgi:GYF domain 2
MQMADAEHKPDARWYYVLERKKVGPVPLPQLQELARSGRLQPPDMVLQDGATQWVTASSVKGLFSGWHYQRGSKTQGPVLASRLKQLASRGELSPTDLVWKDGMPKWVPAQKLKGLFPAPTAGGNGASAQVTPATVNPTLKPTPMLVHPAGPSDPRFYCLVDGKPFGPLTWKEMQGHVASGQLELMDQVWVEGAPQWVAAQTIRGLFPKTAVPWFQRQFSRKKYPSSYR